MKGKIRSLIKKGIGSGEIEVKEKSRSKNIFHCCAHKTGSQWVRGILTDPVIFKYSGLKGYNPEQTPDGGVDERKLKYKIFNQPFPADTIVTPFYMNFGNFSSVPKPENYKSFFVIRDPRDLAVSYYYSIKYSHPVMANVGEMRCTLDKLLVSEGLVVVMEDLEDYGTFEAMRSWALGARHDPRVLVVKYEDLTGATSFEVFRKLFSHCDIRIPERLLHDLLERHNFYRLKKSHPGGEKQISHYRKGKPGEWANYFNDGIETKFRGLTGDLTEMLGYPAA
jgi:hypothetical protein